MRAVLVSLITTFCVLIQAIEAPWTLADSPRKDDQPITIAGHVLTPGDVIVGALVIHTMIDRSLYGLARAYFEIEDKDFAKATAKLTPRDPKKVLYISSFDPTDSLHRVSRLRFEEQFGKHPNALFLETFSPRDLIFKLKALPQDSSFDLIEIDMHGNGGTLGFADGSILSRSDHPWLSKPRRHVDVDEFKKANLKIAASGASLRVSACRIADDLKSDQPIGREFLADFGKSLLPNGGRVLGTEKLIVNVAFVSKVMRRIPLAGTMQNIKDLVKYVANQKVPKGFRFRKDVVKIDIPPREPSCAPAVMQALQKALRKE